MLELKNTNDVDRTVIDPSDHDTYESVLAAVDANLRAALAARRQDPTIDMMRINQGAWRDLRRAERHFGVADVEMIEKLAAICAEDDLLTKVQARNKYTADHIKSAATNPTGRFRFPSQYLQVRNFLADNGDILADATERLESVQ